MVNITHMCLNPRFRLRTQMMLSFGSTAVIALGSFIMIGLYTASNSGKSVGNQARGVVTELVKHSLSSTAQYVAETMTKKFNNLGGAGSLLAEVTRDRFVGYPNMEGWEEDAFVPFHDTLSQSNVYPLAPPDLRLDWQSQGNVNYLNYEEHLPDRPIGWYEPLNITRVDTSNAAYFMQGVCDPDETDPSAPTYYPDCSEEHNNVRLGGAIRPTSTNWWLYSKSKDISWALKPLYESHNDVKSMGVYFANEGAGSKVSYPSIITNGQGTYESIGCDWMYTVHPRSEKVVATRSEVENCHAYGANVTMREYNALERSWCKNQVEWDMDLAAKKSSVAAHNIKATGPYWDASSRDKLWVLTFGQAVFDRYTDQFVACTLVDASVATFYEILVGMSKVGDTSESALIRWGDDLSGTVIVASQWNPVEQEQNAHVTDESLNLGVTPELYREMLELVDFSQTWNPEDIKAAYAQEVFVSSDGGNRLIMMHPVPSVPDVYDPVYKPEYMILISITDDEAYGLLDEMDLIIEYDVTESWKQIGMIGGIGFGVVILMIGYISSTLTRPLRWMQKVSKLIVDNAGGTDLKKGLAEELQTAHRYAHPWCAPRTEVTKLLREFEQMIHDFSGEGAAAEVAGIAVNEVKNRFEWRRMYEDIYPWETVSKELEMEKVPGTTIPRQLSIAKTSMMSMDMFEDELTTDSTTNTDHTLLSVLSASITSSLIQVKQSPPVERALQRLSSRLSVVKDAAVNVGVKAGVLPAPEQERVEGPPFVNRGENIVHPPDKLNDFFDGVAAGDNSFLFWWTTLLVGTPILVTAILISVSVASDTTSLIPLWLSEVKERSIIIERNAIITAVTARSFFGEQVLFRFIRDLHLYSRMAEWLLFGALQRANSFTQTVRGADQCKNYDPEQETLCPFFENPMNIPCDCAWGDPRNEQCWSYNVTDTRHFQARFFEGQSDDVDVFGTRQRTSFPNVGVHPSATNWWNDTREMPGYEKGDNASGYETTYDRVRVMSAMFVVDAPLYNYNPGIGEDKNLGTFVAFEKDGMMTGYGGCSHSHANYAHWQSTEKNQGAEANGQACPVGKYGYDARCRNWYAQGKEKGGVYVTPPYQFASSNTFAGSATYSLVDPITSLYVGQTLMDFLPDAFMRALKPSYTQIGHGTSGFPVVITPEPDAGGADVLVGPGFSLGTPRSISSIVLPYDEEGSTNRLQFEENVASRMRNGENGHASLQRTTAKGDNEKVFMTYAPIEQRTLQPLEASVYSAGCTSNNTLIYSIGFGITFDDLALPFTEVEDKVTSDVQRVKYISLALIVAAVLSVLYMTYTMCLYLSQPILVLIAIVKSIENKSLQDDLPPLEGGSCEIYDVYESLEQLCKIVRFSNAAFFKGDRTKSYKVMEDALDLFVRMGNQKALGVANNNLGTMVLQEQMERSSITARSDDVYLNGVKYFEEAIRIGTFEYQNAGFNDERGNYVKQLANRYFNRGMFFVVNKNHPMAPKNLEETGIRDLVRAKSLDEEAHLYMRERGQLAAQACNQFGCFVRRARGMLTLIQQDSGFQDVWGIDKLIDDAEDMLRNPYYEQSNLYEGINLVARKQQITDLRIQVALTRDQKFEAAEMAIKMLVEDEYIIDTVIMNCVTVLNKYYELEAGNPMQVPNLAQGVKRETRRGAVDSMREAKNVIFCLDCSGSMAGDRMARANLNLLWVYEEHCLDKDHIGFVRFNHAVDTKLYFDLGRKGANQEYHESILRQATDADGGTRLYAALNKCVNMAMDSGNPYDNYVIALTDGASSWDFPAKQVIGRIDKYNRKGGPRIHVIVIGFEVSADVAESVAAVTSVTDKSLYIDAKGGLDEMDNAFEQVAAVITGNAITMETF